MDIRTTVTIDTTPEQVAEVLMSKELADARMKLLGVTDYTHTVSGDTATTDARVGADRLPDIARRFVKGGVHITVTANKAGNTVSYTVDPHGLPAKASLTETANENGAGGTTVDVAGELNIKIPLVGAKLEKQAAGYMERIVRKDARLIADIIG